MGRIITAHHDLCLCVCVCETKPAPVDIGSAAIRYKKEKTEQQKLTISKPDLKEQYVIFSLDFYGVESDVALPLCVCCSPAFGY